MPFATELTQQHGFIHAGVISALADTACGFAALSLMPEDARGADHRVQDQPPVAREGRAFLRAGSVVRPGKKLMVCLGEVFAEDAGKRKQVALVTASMRW